MLENRTIGKIVVLTVLLMLLIFTTVMLIVTHFKKPAPTPLDNQPIINNVIYGN